MFKKQASVLNRVEIISANLINNFHILKKQGKNNNLEIFPVLKANAYGHGLEECVKILESQNPTYFIVDSYYEALKIRKISNSPVLIIGPNSLDNIKYILKKRFTLTVTNIITLKKIVSEKKETKIHLSFNTGMNREGFVKNDISNVIKILKKNPKINCEGIFSHFADADGEFENYTELQEKNFSEILDFFNQNEIYPKWIHLGNSAGFLKTKNNRINAFRTGIALYGINPLPKNDKKYDKLKNLKPALRLISTVTDLQELKLNDSVSYNCTFKAKGKTKIALLPIGYEEFFDRKLSNCGYVKYKDIFLPIVGRICMNLTLFDTKNLPIKTGTEIIVISENPKDKNSIENIAKLVNTIPYETLIRVNNTHRRFIV